MRAFAVRSFGEAPAIRDLPVPAADGACLLRVAYAGVNPLDNNNLARLTASSAYPYVRGVDSAARPSSACRAARLRHDHDGYR
jgi:NADPH:quinone reductase-like Zn-dependent oxidoreductase